MPYLLIVLASMAVLWGCPSEEPQTNDQEANKALARRWIEDLWEAEEPAVADELLADSFWFNWASPGVAPDREGYKATLAQEFASYSDYEFEIEDLLAEGNQVAVRWSSRCNHTGEAMGIPPTGKAITMNGTSLLTINEGRIEREWTDMDMFGLMTQLGAIPTAGRPEASSD